MWGFLKWEIIELVWEPYILRDAHWGQMTTATHLRAIRHDATSQYTGSSKGPLILLLGWFHSWFQWLKQTKKNQDYNPIELRERKVSIFSQIYLEFQRLKMKLFLYQVLSLLTLHSDEESYLKNLPFLYDCPLSDRHSGKLHFIVFTPNGVSLLSQIIQLCQRCKVGHSLILCLHP